jgi:hypothetical protein
VTAAHRDDAPVCEVLLLANLIFGPASLVELGKHVLTAGIAFGNHSNNSVRAFRNMGTGFHIILPQNTGGAQRQCTNGVHPKYLANLIMLINLINLNIPLLHA